MRAGGNYRNKARSQWYDAETKKGTFTGLGDASPENVNEFIASLKFGIISIARPFLNRAYDWRLLPVILILQMFEFL